LVLYATLDYDGAGFRTFVCALCVVYFIKIAYRIYSPSYYNRDM
jgi:hypothetical protein